MRSDSADVLIVGGGVGGVSAALAALKRGRTVILTEPTAWLGGQFTTQLGSAFTYTVGSTLQIRAQATGTSPTTVRAKVWKTTLAEPGAWQLTTIDSSAGLQASGGVGVVTYLSGTSTNFPIVVSFDDLLVTVP